MEGEFQEEEEKRKSPAIYFIAVFLIMLIFVFAIPRWAIKIDKSPSKIPTLNEIREIFQLSNDTQYKRYENVHSAIKTNEPRVKAIANYIATESCDSYDKPCYAKALYIFVRDNIKYVNDPQSEEFVMSPEMTFTAGSGDCDDGAVLLYYMLNSIGIKTEFVFLRGHVMVKALIPEALKKYKRKDGYVYLDWTCKACNFGELPSY